jgi:hypothetical protein
MLTTFWVGSSISTTLSIAVVSPPPQPPPVQCSSGVTPQILPPNKLCSLPLFLPPRIYMSVPVPVPYIHVTFLQCLAQADLPRKQISSEVLASLGFTPEVLTSVHSQSDGTTWPNVRFRFIISNRISVNNVLFTGCIKLLQSTKATFSRLMLPKVLAIDDNG